MTMQKIDVTSPEAQSADLVVSNIAQLKALFPELLTESSKGATINLDVLKALVGDATVTDADEKYSLNWHGKRRARQLALMPSTGTLRPCPEESIDWDTTQNLMIEGDNLEVLKLLQKSYAGKVKLIYIDPPYNTGKDFVYPDNFHSSIKNYLELTGQAENGAKLSTNSDASGRYHTDWLSMMYPRLKLARNLMRDDGLIFVSIDDTEVHHLRAIMSEIFGEENFVGNIVWEKAYTANMTAKFISNTHDHIVVYAKNIEFAEVGKFERTEDQIAKFRNSDDDPRGVWKAENLSAGKYYAAGQFEIVGPTGTKFSPPPGRYWRCNERQYKEWLADGRITFGLSGEGRPMLKKFLSEMEDGLTPSTWWVHDKFGSNKEASLELKELFDGGAYFQTPKPTKLLKRICSLVTSGEDIVMDFFAGSGTMGHAVWAQNLEDSGSRRFVLVQLPEPLDPDNKDQKEAARFCLSQSKPLNISELTKDRLRRAAIKLRANAPMFPSEMGFRVFRLDASNIQAWTPQPMDIVQALFEHQEHLLPGRTEQDLLYELLLKLGLDLCVPIKQLTIAGKSVHAVGAGVLLACLAEDIAATDVEELSEGIVRWYQELAPVGEVTCVFRDSAFANDVAKTNMAAILQQQGIQNVRSL